MDMEVRNLFQGSWKIVISLMGVFVLVGGLVAGIILVQRSQELRRQAAPATSLFFVPATQNKSPGDSFSAVVSVDTGENKVSGMDIKLKFDPSALEIVSITKGAGIAVFDQIITNTFDNNLGTVSFSAFTLDKTKAVQGSGLSVLNISAKVKENVSLAIYQISFEGGTAVAGVSEGQNVLINSTPARINVIGGGGSPTPTATPVNTPTPTPTSNGQVTPTPTPTNVSSTPTPTSTVFPVPESGISSPTIFGIGIGILLLIGSLLLAL